MYKGLFRCTCSGDQIEKEVLSWRKSKITEGNIHIQNKRHYRSRGILCFPRLIKEKNELSWVRHFNFFTALTFAALFIKLMASSTNGVPFTSRVK